MNDFLVATKSGTAETRRLPAEAGLHVGRPTAAHPEQSCRLAATTLSYTSSRASGQIIGVDTGVPDGYELAVPLQHRGRFGGGDREVVASAMPAPGHRVEATSRVGCPPRPEFPPRPDGRGRSRPSWSEIHRQHLGAVRTICVKGIPRHKPDARYVEAAGMGASSLITASV